MARNKPKKVAIVGLGLIGGSLGLALKKYAPEIEVTGVSRSSAKAQQAKRKKIVDYGTDSLSSGVKDADIVVICTPVSTIAGIAESVDKFAKKGAVVTDVGSAKSELMKRVKKAELKKVVFVGSHPMAGSHESGMQFAEPELFSGALTFVISCSEPKKKGAIQKIASLWKAAKSNVSFVDAATHDKIVSKISHLPHVLASLLVNGVSSECLPFASSGFLDTTRVAQGDPGLWLDIILDNRKNLAKDLKKLIKQMEDFSSKLSGKRPEEVLVILKKAQRIRQSIN